MHFQTHEFGKTEGFFEQVTDILQVGERSLSADVGFAAEDDPVADGEVVEEHRFLAAGALDK